MPGGAVVNAYRTPSGNHVEFECRPGTNDANICTSVVAHDEYGLADLTIPLGATVLDVGAYIGAFTIAAVAEFSCNVTAIEPVVENIVQLAHNVGMNGMLQNVEMRRVAVGHDRYTTVRLGYQGLNSFVGNLGEGPAKKKRRVRSVSLTDLVNDIGPVALMKVDCEGCEWDFLDDPALGQIATIVGELHGDGDMESLLEPTHHFHMIGDYVFRADVR